MRYKILLLTLFSGLFIIKSVYANEELHAPGDEGRNLIINIKNRVAENCQLVEKKLMQGKVLYGSVPSILYATDETSEFIIRAPDTNKDRDYETELSLKYACGANKTFELYIKNFQKAGHRHRSTDIKFDSADLVAKYTVIPGSKYCPGNILYKYIDCTSIGKATKVDLKILTSLQDGEALQ